MNQVQLIMMVALLSQAYPRYSFASIHTNQCKCRGYNKNSRSIIVKNAFGNLGNKMSIYAILYLFKLKYGYDIYVTKEVHDHLKYVFENLGNVK